MIRILIALCFLFSNTALQARMITIGGVIQNPNQLSISFGFQDNDLTENTIRYSTSLREDNSFSLSFDAKNQTFIYVNYGEIFFQLFIPTHKNEAGFEFDVNDPVHTMSFKGDTAFDNSFLNSFRRYYQTPNKKPKTYDVGGLSTFIDAGVHSKANSYGVEDYFRMLEEDYFRTQRHLHNQTSLDRSLFRYLDNEINWCYETNKIAYFLLNNDRIKKDMLQRYWIRFGVLRNVDINDDTSLKHAAYRNLLHGFIHYLSLESPGDKEQQDLAYYRFVEGNLQGKSRHYMLAKLMLDMYQKGSAPRLAQRRFEKFKRDNPYQEYTTTLEQAFGAKLEFVPKTVVPDFTVMGLSQETIALNQYRGKVVYISFWASWCAPCIRNFQETYSARIQLEQMGVVMLNINLDKTETEWRRALDRLQFPGKNVYALDMKALQDKLKISSIPHYIIVNKSGMLTFLSSEKINETLPEFQRLINE